MSDKKATKRALLTSIVSLFLCFAMLLGTTFAWFTDSVSNTGNRIIAGTLKIDLLMHKKVAETYQYTSIAGGSGDLFREATRAQNDPASLWEPGKTQIVFLAVQNKGSLALKYNIILDISDISGYPSMVHGEPADADYYTALEFALLDGAKAISETQFTYGGNTYTLSTLNWTTVQAATAQKDNVELGRVVAAENGVMDELPNVAPNYETQYFALAVHMKEDAGNEFQGAGINIDVNVVATQLEKEKDIFDNNTYDHQAHVHSYVLMETVAENGIWKCVSELNVLCDDNILEGTDAAYAMVLGPAGKFEPTTVIPLTEDGNYEVGAGTIVVAGNEVTYTGGASAQTVIIRTNSAETTLKGTAANDTIYHYGVAGTVNLPVVASNSFHEYGTVRFVEIAKGRFVLEKTAEIEQVHISTKILDLATNEKSTDTFDEIIIAMDPDVEKPTFSRDKVNVDPDNGTLVVALQTGTDAVTDDTELDYVWLTMEGVYEQIKVSDTSENAGDTWVDDDSISGKTQATAFEIANNINRDGDRKIDVTKEINDVTYTVSVDPETRELVVVNTATDKKVDDTEIVDQVITATTVSDAGLTEEAKAEVIAEVAPEATSATMANDEEHNYVVRIKHVGYEALEDALNAAQSGSVITILGDMDHLTITGVENKNITIDLNGFTLKQGDDSYAIRVYDCDGVTIRNGTVKGQIRIGERKSTIIKWKHLNYGEDNYEAVYGYHPLAPAKNILLKDLTVDSGNVPALFFTNIEEDLVRGAPSNYCDNDLYGQYIYKTGYTTKDQYINNLKSEVFTACTDKDSVTVSGGSYTGASFVGNMVTYAGEQIEGVLTVTDGMTTNSSDAGRYVADGKCLVGTASNTFTVSNTVPVSYTANTGSIFFTYAGGANDAIRFARIGETVSIAENANAAKEIAQNESFTVISLAEGISWTGATVTRAVENPALYEIVKTPDSENPLKIVYTIEFAEIARVYHVGDTRQTPTSKTAYDSYGSLKAAVEAAGTGDYVMLMKDTTISDEQTISSNYVNYGINLSARMVLDLNGHTYTYTGGGTAIICTASTGTDSGQRAIRDTSEAKTGTVYATNGYAFAKYNKNSEKTVIYGGNFVSATTNAVWIKNANVFEIQGGRFISLNNKAPVSGTVTTRSGGTDIQTTVSADQYLIINSDGTFEVGSLVQSENDYTLSAPAGKTVLLPAKPIVGYVFNGWSSTDGINNGIFVNSSESNVQFTTNYTELTEFKINYSETNATLTVMVNGEEWDKISYVKPGDRILVTVEYSEENFQNCTIKDEAGNSYSTGTEFDMPRANLTITASSSSSCFASGTLITLADGTQKAIELLDGSEKILVWNFFTGEYDQQDLSILVNHGEADYLVSTLEFSNGSTIRLIGDHGLFDYDLNRFVYVTAENLDSYVGHRFVVAGEGGTYEFATLVGMTEAVERTVAYSISSVSTFNAFADGFLTVAPPEDFYNWIAMGDPMRYDAEQFAADLATYGTYEYDIFADYVTYEQYEAFNGAYLKIAVEKGYFTFDYIVELIDTYLSFMR